MQLFLASYRFGAHRDRFLAMAGERRRIAVIANACDSWGEAARGSALTSDLAPLRKLGFDAHEIDLRDFVGGAADLRTALSDAGLVWVRGGNTFVLRAQLARTDGDRVLPQLISQGIVGYAGYSAGACVLTPSLRGLDAVDDPAEVAPTCGVAPIWTGLGLVSQAIVPHCDSDPTSAAVAQRYGRDGVPHWALTDDRVIVVDGGEPELL